MGLLNRIKDFFNKNIECGEEIDNHIVFPYTKKKYLYVKKNILVRDNTACVIVCKHKVCDILMPGKYKISEDNLEETFSRSKAKKNGLKRIKVDIYYINTSEIKNFEFQSDEPFSIKSDLMGKMVGFLQGVCTLRVIDPEKLIRALIAETGKAKLDEIKEDIGLWVGNKINKTIQKYKINTNIILTEQEHAQNLLNTYLEDGYDNIGLFVKNIKLKAVDFPKKYQKKANEYLSKHARPVKHYSLGNGVDFGNRGVSSHENPATVSRIQANRNAGTMQNNKNSINVNAFKYCSQCGAQVENTSRFCRNCGKSL